jgi:hypothetical protein
MSEKKTTTIPLTITFAGEMESLIRLIEASDSTGRAFALKRLREIAAWLDVNVELGNVDSKEEQATSAPVCAECKQEVGYLHWTTCRLGGAYHAGAEFVTELDCKEVE